MTLVVDASLVVASLLNAGRDGIWARQIILADDVSAPHHVLVEVSNVLRKRELAGEISGDVASIAHAELLAMAIDLHPYDTLGIRVWELRHTVTAYDAAYIALAEHLEAPLATVDLRLTRAPGPRCEFLTPPATP